MELENKIDFTTELPQEVIGCICAQMDAATLIITLSVNKKLNTIGNNYIDQHSRLMTNPDHIYALVIGLQRSGKSCLTTIFTGSGNATRLSTKTTTNTLYVSGNVPSPFQVTLFNPPGAQRKEVWKRASACDLPLIVVDTNPIGPHAAEELKELVASTCHLINASNHVIVAVNMLDTVVTDHLAVYERVKQSVLNLLREIGLNHCQSVPVQAVNGTNTSDTTPKFSWYHGPTLRDLFVKFRQQARLDPSAYEQLSNAALKYQIFDSNWIPGVGAVFLGRVLSGTLSQDKSYYIAMVQPLKSWICRLCSIQSRLMNIDHAKPGLVVGINIAPVGRRDMYEFRGYATKEVNDGKFHKTLAFRAELDIFSPQKFGPNRYFTHPSRKIVPIIEKTTNTPENILKWKAAANGRERPKRTLLNKATAIIVMRDEFPLKIATNSPFEKNYDGKVVLVSGSSFIASGKIQKTVNEPASPLDLHNKQFTKAVYDKLMSRASEFFTLPKEQEQYDRFLAHERTNQHARHVFLTEEEFALQKNKSQAKNSKKGGCS